MAICFRTALPDVDCRGSLKGAPIPIALTNGFLTSNNRTVGVVVTSGLVVAHGEEVLSGKRGRGSESLSTGEARRARLSFALPDKIVGPAVVAGSTRVALRVKAGFLVKRDIADAVGGAIDVATAAAVVSTSQEAEDCGACWSSAARGSGVGL